MHERERWSVILGQLAQQPVVTVTELQALLGSSAATVRRDLSRLEEQGKLRRLHGGAELAGSAPPQLRGQQPFESSRKVNSAAKVAIARRAAEMCTEGDSIIVDGGSTTFAMVEFLCRMSLQVLTSSFPIAEALLRNGTGRVLVPGGEIFREQDVILSPFADGVLKSFHASKLFIGAQGVGAQGLMQTDPLLVSSEQRLMEQAGSLVVLVDSSKFHRSGSLILCDLRRIDTLITDDAVPEDAVRLLESAGVQVIKVRVEGHGPARN
jgi:DeoR family ulaG and ulaABCDEF operon transcriptional repressor